MGMVMDMHTDLCVVDQELRAVRVVVSDGKHKRRATLRREG